jgi:hypothetical protein
VLQAFYRAVSKTNEWCSPIKASIHRPNWTTMYLGVTVNPPADGIQHSHAQALSILIT